MHVPIYGVSCVESNLITNVTTHSRSLSSTRQKQPDFLDLFTEYIVDLIAEHENIVLVGDFNIHINNEDNPNAVIFLDTMTAPGLHQY